MSSNVCFWRDDGEKRLRLFSCRGRIYLVSVEKYIKPQRILPPGNKEESPVSSASGGETREAAGAAPIAPTEDEKGRMTGLPSGTGAASSNESSTSNRQLPTSFDRAGIPRGSKGPTFLVSRTVRSGQRFKYAGNIVVMGDVHPGGEIVASGHIIVMGTCKGVVHAGAEGDEKAVVIAFRLQPTQLRIAGYITRAPDDENPGGGEEPEIARVQDEAVIIEKYQPGGEKRWISGSTIQEEEEQHG
jgi:septum site-determining protein MinC